MEVQAADGTEQGTRKPIRTRRVITELVTIKVSSEDSGDAVTVMEVQTPPGGGVPPHTQRYEDESIYILEGTYELFVDGVVETVSAGDVRFIRRGMRHGFANTGPGPARMVIHLFPGGIHEQFINAVGDDPDRPMWESDLGRILSLAPAYGIEFDDDNQR